MFSTSSQRNFGEECYIGVGYPASLSPRKLYPTNSISYGISTPHVRVTSRTSSNGKLDDEWAETNDYQYPQTSRWNLKVSPYQGISIILVIIATIIALVFYIKKVEKNKKNKDLPNQIQV